MLLLKLLEVLLLKYTCKSQSFLVIQALYGLSMCTVKWSMLFMLKRIFAVKPFEVGAPVWTRNQDLAGGR